MRRGPSLLVAACAGVLVTVGAVASTSPTTARATSAPAGPAAALLGVRDGPEARERLRAAGARPVAAELGIWRIASGRSVSVAAALRRAGLLRWVERDRHQPRATLGAGDPRATPDAGWHLYRVGVDRITLPAAGVPLAILDSGLDTTHVELRSRPDTTYLNAHSPVTWDTPNYHGTYVALVAAAPADAIGGVGVYPQASLRSFALPQTFGGPLSSDVVRGLVAASSSGRTVINISLSGSEYSRAEYEAILAATRRGALVVVAAGNEGTRGNPRQYPASLPHVLTVGATGLTDTVLPFSSTGPAVDLAAPGEGIPVQHPTDPLVWDTVSGTSFAAPTVAAAAALIWTLRPTLDAGQVAEVLRRSARDVDAAGFDERSGFGILDIPAALAAPTPPRDLQEPNDDVAQVVPGRAFAGTTPLLTRSKRTAQIQAAIDAWEDPSDVYRVVLPPGRALTVTLRAATNLATSLWAPTTKTVLAKGAALVRDRLAVSNKPGTQAERIVYRNRTRTSRTLFVDVWPARGAARHADYTLTLAAR